MKFMLLIYNESELLDAMPTSEFNASMRDCLAHADALHREGTLLESRMLGRPDTARSVRIRNGRRIAVDGPFAETKEVLGGFNLIEATDMEEALRIAEHFPWVRTGCVEVRPVQDIDEVRQQVGAVRALASNDPASTP
ncbi:MAG TPA: YciI family protein [Gemmatimonadaceae bacterium]|nr:YciI family protein [Gemmatimonadaceae bacterium]